MLLDLRSLWEEEEVVGVGVSIPAPPRRKIVITATSKWRFDPLIIIGSLIVRHPVIISGKPAIPALAFRCSCLYRRSIKTAIFEKITLGRLRVIGETRHDSDDLLLLDLADLELEGALL